MQPYSLTVDKFLDHAAKWHANSGIVAADAGTAVGRLGYAELRERANRLSGALLSLGLALGDRVATLAWNTPHHFELYYAAMGAGLVCHTLNPRLTAEHLAAVGRFGYSDIHRKSFRPPTLFDTMPDDADSEDDEA